MESKKDGSIKPFLDYDHLKNIRQLKPKYYARNGAAIYITSYQSIMKYNSLLSEIIFPYFMEKEESFDIDDEIDWKIVEIFI